MNQKVKTWLEKTVIGLNLCPFAKEPFEEDLIRIASCSEMDPVKQMHFFMDELDVLQRAHPKSIATSLVVFENASPNFETFYSFHEECLDNIYEVGLGEEVMAIVFHPKFHFEGLDPDDKANYVNRSPFPLIHLVRKKDMSAALTRPEEGEAISRANEEKLKALSDEQFAEHFTFFID